MAMFDFIRKTGPNATPSPADPPQDMSQYNSPVVAGQSLHPQSQMQGTQMHGVGNPVMPSYTSGGAAVMPQQSSYNGIGNTPSGGMPYNGIGAAPAPQFQNPPTIQQPPVYPVSDAVPPQSQSMNAPVMPKPIQQQYQQPVAVAVQTIPKAPQPVVQNAQVQQPRPQQQVPQPRQDVGSRPPVAQQNSQQRPSAQVQQPRPQQQNSQPRSPDVNKQAQQPSSLKSNIDTTKRGDLDVMTHLTQRSNKVFVDATNKAKELKNTYVDSEHILFALTNDGEIYKILIDLRVQPQIIQQELVKLFKKETSANLPQVSPRIKQITSNSLTIARKLGYEFISPEHILLALMEEGEGVGARVLVKLGLQKQDLYKKITGKSESLIGPQAAGGKEREKTAKQKTALEQYTVDLTAKAAAGELDPVVERSEVIERLVHILSRRIKNNPALIGEPGVGKTAVVEGLAQRIVQKQVPESLMGKRILVLDLMNIVAGASHRGEFEERMKNVVDELKSAKGEIIMFIDEMHMMMGAGSGDGSLDASNFIKPALARGEVQLIGATTITEYRKYIEKDAALERRFQTVVVPEPSIEAAIKMLKAARNKYEAFHKVKISDEVIDLCVKLSKRYIGDRFLPDKGFDLMDEGAAAVRLPLISLPEEIKSMDDQIAKLKQEYGDRERTGEKVRARIIKSKIDEAQAKLNSKRDEYNMKKAQVTTEVTSEMIKDIIARRTGIPINKITSTEGDRLVNMEDIIHKRMIDQERAVKSVSQAIRRGRAGLKSTNRPIGSFIFLGPSGVGKTELAKTVAEVLFDEEDAVIRFDMTEYMERHEVAKLLGPPPGYVGYEEGGKLTEAVRRRPYALVLFDEVEKAHPDIFNILLQILDDGRLTDNKGRTISFKNTVIICTSNIGTRLIQDELLKNGKTEVGESPAISTYVFTPRGREILTIGQKYFERDSNRPVEKMADQTPSVERKEPQAQAPQVVQTGWEDHVIPDYFAGQKLEGVVPAKEEKPVDPNLQKDPAAQKPEKEKPEEETKAVAHFPAFGYDTHVISPKGVEIVTKGNVIYMRDATTSKVWRVSNLIDHFKDQIVRNAMPDAPDEQLPTIRLKSHAFTLDGTEIITFKDRYWTKKQDATDWETGLLKDYFKDQTIEKGGTFPTTHWDIHTFAPTGRELVIVGTDIFYREKGSTAWVNKKLGEYFGKDFPLDREIATKETVEAETDKKKYDIIKEKVMAELLKFFRPELVNRFDEAIIFEPLKFIHMIEIVKLQLKGLTKLLEEQEMGFSATDSAVKQIVREGFDPLYGARPLRRAIQKFIENPISELIIAKKVKIGDTIVVDYNGEEFVFDIEHVGHADKEKKEIVKKKFICQNCKNIFETEVIKNATPICSTCANAKVAEYSADSQNNPKDLGPVQDQPKKPEEPKQNPEPTKVEEPVSKEFQQTVPQTSDSQKTPQAVPPTSEAQKSEPAVPPTTNSQQAQPVMNTV